MANYKVVLHIPGNRIDAVTKKVEEIFGTGCVVSKIDLAKSRADRLAVIANDVANSASDVEELKAELEEWLEALPENLQNGDKASELQEAIDQLEELKSNLEDVDFSSVSFPSMM
jgi:hypothetical protein